MEAPARLAEVLAHDEAMQAMAAPLAAARDVLYLGRGAAYPVALEGAQAQGDLLHPRRGLSRRRVKHGPIALIDEHVPVIFVAPSDGAFDKTASNAQEVAARGGKVILLADSAGIAKLKSLAAATLEMPKTHPFVAPILYAVPVQLLAYHTAILKGTDVDQPRNLAKSVTVE